MEHIWIKYIRSIDEHAANLFYLSKRLNHSNSMYTTIIFESGNRCSLTKYLFQQNLINFVFQNYV